MNVRRAHRNPVGAINLRFVPTYNSMNAPVISRLLFTAHESDIVAYRRWLLQIPISPLIPFTINSPRLHLFFSCLSHAAPCVLVHIFLCLHAHPMLDATHHIHLATFLLKAFKRSLFFFFRERKAELLLHRLVAAIVERWKRQKLKRENRTLDLMNFLIFRDMTLRHRLLISPTHTRACLFRCVCWCIPSESKFFISRFFFRLHRKRF